jgi:hypothetical protein
MSVLKSCHSSHSIPHDVRYCDYWFGFEMVYGSLPPFETVKKIIAQLKPRLKPSAAAWLAVRLRAELNWTPEDGC